jgi:hypothetical protein
MSNFLTQNDSGSGLPYIQWGSDAVQWTRKKGDGKEVFKFQNAIFDIENLKVGWIKVAIGVYDAKLAHYKDATPERPTETSINQQGATVPAYNKGFAVNVLLGKEFAPDRLYTFSTSQKGSLEAVGNLLSQYEEQKDANQGKVPVVTFDGHVNKKFGKGSTNIPNLNITSWVDRPMELDVASAAPAPQQNNAPAQSAPVAVGGSEF